MLYMPGRTQANAATQSFQVWGAPSSQWCTPPHSGAPLLTVVHPSSQ